MKLQTVIKSLIVLSLPIVVGCAASNQSSNSKEYGSPLISEQNLRNNLYYLASAEMEGRETTKHGQKLAARFIESEMIKAGVRPAGDNGTYFQNFNVDVSGVDKDSSFIVVNGKKYLFGKDYFSFSQGTGNHYSNNLELVFVGYGIKNDSLQIDDFKGKDLKGKWIALYTNSFPKGYTLKSSQGRGQGGFFAKFAEFNKQGVAGIIGLSTSAGEKQFAMLADYLGGEQMQISDSKKGNKQGNNQNRRGGLSMVTASGEFSNDLLKLFGLDANQTRTAAESGENIATSNKTLSFAESYKKYTIQRETQNVVGYIPGTDPTLSKTFVAMGAHYDHQGISASGAIFYGADDDGSGTTVTLETMRVFGELAKQGKGTKRSLVFAFHTGEEKGLLGSEYLTDNGLPTIMDSLKQIIVNVNMDMVGREDVDSLDIVGHDRLSTDFGNLVEQVNKDMNLFKFNYTFNDPNDPARIYFRSDHYNYAKHGIPIVFFTDGMGENWKKGSKEDDYHKLTDTPDKINYPKMYKVSQLSFEIIKRVANSDKAPVVDKK